jgi:hypothetical protein
LIRSPELKADVMSQLNNPEYSTKDVFIYSVLKFHQDFFNEMDKQ